MKKQSQLHTHKKIVSQDPSTEEKHPVSAFRFHPPSLPSFFTIGDRSIESVWNSVWFTG